MKRFVFVKNLLAKFGQCVAIQSLNSAISLPTIRNVLIVQILNQTRSMALFKKKKNKNEKINFFLFSVMSMISHTKHGHIHFVMCDPSQ